MTQVRIPMRISGTSTVDAGPPVSTAEVVARVAGTYDADRVVRLTGIRSRRFAPPETTAAELGAQALRGALSVAKLPADALRRLIFVSSVGGDDLIPATANRVAAGLGLAGSCDTFDLSNACMGSVLALDVAARTVSTGYGPVGITVVELGSRFISPEDPRPFYVVADAAVAMVVEPAEGDDEGVVASWSRTHGSVGAEVTLRHPGATGQRETIRFETPNQGMKELAVEFFRRSAERLLLEAGLTLGEVEWVVPHQPNGVMLREVVEKLGVDPDRVMPMVEDVGSVGAASIPIGLDHLLRSGRVRNGDRVLLVGVGAGGCAGGMLLRVSQKWLSPKP